jgi:hypothetical protein
MNGSPLSVASPFSVNVGDTIVWSMSFDAGGHNLGVATSGGSIILDKGYSTHTYPGGSSLSLVVPSTTGLYGFACSFHSSNFTQGMAASFNVVAAGVALPPQPVATVEPLTPNPVSTQAMVHFSLDKPAHVVVSVYDNTGKLMLKAADEDMQSGFQMVMFDTKSLAAGSYQYVVQAGDAVIAKEMVVVK